MRFLSPIGKRSAKSGRAQGRDPVRYRSSGGRTRRRKAPDHRVVHRAAIAAAGIGLLSGAAWLWTSGWVDRGLTSAGDALLAATSEVGLKVKDVLVEGRSRTKRSAVLNALGVARGMPVLGFDPQAARARLQRLPWVRTAMVERRLPDVIYVRLTERQPLALWQHEGRLAVIDQGGDVIAKAEPKAFAQLPLIVGDDAPRHATELLAMIESEPELKPRVSAAVRVRGRRWNVRLDHGIDVRLPEQDAAAAWSQLARIQREHNVLERDVVIIDLRMPDRLIVRTAPGMETESKPRHAGEET